MRNNPPLSDTNSSSRGGTSNGTSTTPSTSTIETPVLPRVRKFFPNFAGTPETPIFSKEAKEIIHKQRRELNVQIMSLNQQKNLLQVELNKIKSNIVSQGELQFLKAETRSQISSSNSNHLKELMNNFIDIIRDVSAARATCSILEQKIKEESQRRAQIVGESQQISDAMDFTEFFLTFPKLSQNEIQKISKPEEQQMISLNQKLQEIWKDTISCEGVIKAANPKNKETALEIARSAESQWQLKSLGTIILRNEIQRLQRAATVSDSQLKKLENSIEDDHKKMSEAKLKNEKEEALALSNFNHNKEEFDKDLKNINDEITRLNNQIKISAKAYDTIIQDIKKFDEQPKHIDQDDDIDDDTLMNTDDDNEIFEFSEEKRNRENETQQLYIKKQELIKEIESMKHQINKQKKKAKIRQNKLIDDIKKLQGKARTYSAYIKRSFSQLTEADSSSVSTEIQSLIEKIDSSLTDLHSVINN